MKLNKKKNGLRIKRTLQNIIFAIGIVWRSTPHQIVYTVLSAVVVSFSNFFSSTWMTRYIFNSIQQKHTFEQIMTTVLVAFSLIIGIWMVRYYIDRVKKPLWRAKVTRDLNHLLLKKVANVDLACYEDTKFYKKFTMTVPEAMGGTQDFATSILNDAAYCLINLITNAALILVIDPFLLVFAFIPFISNLLFGKIGNRLQFDYQMQMREIKRDKDYVDRVFYLSDYAKEIRMTNIHKVMMRRFFDDLKDTQKRTGKFGFKTVRFLFLKGLLDGTLVYYAGVFYAAFHLLISHTLLVGDCIVLSSALSTVSNGLGCISFLYTKMNQHAMFLENMRGFLEYKNKITSPSNASEPDKENAVIHFDNVSFRYDNTDVDILKHVNLTVKKGEKIAIVGVNGSGKSTLIKLMMRLYDVTEGVITYAGKDIRSLDLKAYRELFGVIFQDYKVFAMSVRDNVLLGSSGDDEMVVSALKAAGVYEKIGTLPDGINTILTREYDEDGAVLSGGEFQKICIARVFVRNSPIVILDEPSSSLDPIAEYEMYENMLRVCRDRTAIFISHRLSSAVLADRVVMLENGEIIEEGSHKELIAHGGKYADMFAKQAENYVKGGKNED